MFKNNNKEETIGNLEFAKVDKELLIKEDVEDNMKTQFYSEISENESTYLPIDCTVQCEGKLDNKEFLLGMTEYSYVCGAITALANCGCSVESAIEFIANREAMNHNYEVTKLNCNAQVEASKNSFINNDIESL